MTEREEPDEGTEKRTGAPEGAPKGALAPAPAPHAEPEGGEPVCWLDRVCPECGRLADTAPPTVCARCGAPLDRN